jgi:AraC-like DNA-binding protein
MTLARDHLRAGELTIGQIATQTGYTSPYAFAAAFRRHHGHPPGHWRRQALEVAGTGRAAAPVEH